MAHGEGSGRRAPGGGRFVHLIHAALLQLELALGVGARVEAEVTEEVLACASRWSKW